MAPVRTLAKRTNDPAMPATRAAAVTPNDSTDLDAATRGLYIGTAGALTVITSGGDTVTLVAVPAGSILPLSVTRVLATGTDADDIVALW
jgi:hypothetical protein